jgi:predicted nucleotidyltransferase
MHICPETREERMDVAHPIRTVVPTLDGPVLEVLARSTGPLTSPEVHRLVGTGSVNGIRLALARLARHGLVHAEEYARTLLYHANREHIAWPAVEQLGRLRRSLLDRIGEEISSWGSQPLHASLFGPAARGDGDADSDIDLLLIRPAGVGEDDPPWSEQVDGLRGLVVDWTGNRCQVFQPDLTRLGEHVHAGDPLMEELEREAVTIAGDELAAVLRRLPTPGPGPDR